ncbi:Obp19a [Drosophila busckii]|uniref:Obp19a n=1 Tax=Drosophila busckii TaxID=30019 RepID=A0A0M3QZL9_DROBS|nr:general odorant-binding protein 19a [Drosophila busckii]ALC49609.1 Obp19a [Drosophila busckii]
MLHYHLLMLNCLLLGLPAAWSGATEEQMRAAGKLMRDVCFPKFSKVSEDMANAISNGNLLDDKDSKCYINCIMEMMQTMKKGKFQMESSLKQVDLLMPDEYKPSYRVGIAECKDVSNGIKNNCEASYTMLTCLKQKIPIFLFP